MFLKMKKETDSAPASVMRTTSVGNGFVKEDVLAFIDELNIQIFTLQEENAELRKKLIASAQRIAELEAEKLQK